MARRATFMLWRLCPRWPPCFADQQFEGVSRATWTVRGSAWSLMLAGFGIAMFIAAAIIAFPARPTGLIIDSVVVSLACAGVVSLACAWLMSRTVSKLSADLERGTATLEKQVFLYRHRRECDLNRTELLVQSISLRYGTSYRSPWTGHAVLLWFPTDEYFVLALAKSRDNVLAYAEGLPDQLRARLAEGQQISAAY